MKSDNPMTPLMIALLPVIEGPPPTPKEDRNAEAMRQRLLQAELRAALGGDTAARLEG